MNQNDSYHVRKQILCYTKNREGAESNTRIEQIRRHKI